MPVNKLQLQLGETRNQMSKRHPTSNGIEQKHNCGKTCRFPLSNWVIFSKQSQKCIIVNLSSLEINYIACTQRVSLWILVRRINILYKKQGEHQNIWPGRDGHLKSNHLLFFFLFQEIGRCGSFMRTERPSSLREGTVIGHRQHSTLDSWKHSSDFFPISSKWLQ